MSEQEWRWTLIALFLLACGVGFLLWRIAETLEEISGTLKKMSKVDEEISGTLKDMLEGDQERVDR